MASGAPLDAEAPLGQAAVGKPRALLQRLLSEAGVDRAVMFAVMARTCQAIAGPVTLLLIAHHFTPEIQGFYFTFGSLLALQSFAELGFYLVIINVASHEWARLNLDSAGRIVGDPAALSRLVSLGRLIFKWYAVASTAFVAGVSLVGYLFFSQAPQAAVNWQAPWFVLVALTGLMLWSLPFVSLLEGCNQVASVNQVRLKQVVLGNVALWTTIALGGGLWAGAAWAGASVLRDAYLLGIRYRRFFEPFFQLPAGPRTHWRSEIWPMQWRLAVAGLANYFTFSLFTPIMFAYHGAAVAGQMGMTWQVINALQAVALVWIGTKVPRFGMLIARKDYGVLDRLFFRTSVVSVGVIGCGAIAVLLGLYLLYAWDHPLAHRLLPPLPTALFLLAAVLMQIGQCAVAYLRAHKREPVAGLSVVSGLTIGVLVWLLGSRFGSLGAAMAYVTVVALLIVPYETVLWIRYRAAWHKT